MRGSKRPSHEPRQTVAAAIVAAVLGASACRGDPPRIVHGDAVFGEVGTLSRAHAIASLQLARAVVDGRSHPAVDRLPAPRVFLTLHAPIDANGRRAAPITATALDVDLASSIVAAASSLRARAAPSIAHDGRLQLDVVTAVDDDASSRLGRYGLLTDAGHRVLPGDLFTRGFLGIDDDPRVQKALLAPILAAPIDRARRFSSIAVVESDDHASAHVLDHGLVLPPTLASLADPSNVASFVAVLRDRERLGADYLARALHDDGRFDYLYDAIADEVADDYNDLRHAGATYALFEASERATDASDRARWLSAGDRALAWIERGLVGDVAANGGMHLPDDANALRPIGGTGLLLLAHAKRAAVTQDAGDLPVLRALARFLVGQESTDGELRAFADVDDEPSKVCAYWPGEAILALTRLAEIDPDDTQSDRWLEAATKGALYLVDHPEAYPTRYEREHDDWLAVALVELHALARDPSIARRLADHSLFIARATLEEQSEDEAALDGDTIDADATPRLSPAAVRLEAFSAVAALARRIGRDRDAAAILDGARKIAATVLLAQYDDESSVFLPNPSKARGGFHGAVYAADVRIDHVQHAIVALAAYERVLADPRFGLPDVPSPFARRPLPR